MGFVYSTAPGQQTDLRAVQAYERAAGRLKHAVADSSSQTANGPSVRAITEVRAIAAASCNRKAVTPSWFCICIMYMSVQPEQS